MVARDHADSPVLVIAVYNKHCIVLFVLARRFRILPALVRHCTLTVLFYICHPPQDKARACLLLQRSPQLQLVRCGLTIASMIALGHIFIAQPYLCGFHPSLVPPTRRGGIYEPSNTPPEEYLSKYSTGGVFRVLILPPLYKIYYDTINRLHVLS